MEAAPEDMAATAVSAIIDFYMISKNDILLEKEEPLSDDEKGLFKYFGENAKIRPPFRILNPGRISIGDNVSIREFAYIHAYQDLSANWHFIDEQYKKDFDPESYKYDSSISIERETQIGRNLYVTCTNRISIGNNVTIAERVFLGDNNHSFRHRHVSIMQQPNKSGDPIKVGAGSWIGVGAVLLHGTTLGRNSVVGANSVVQGEFPDYGVIGTEKATLLFVKELGD